VWLGFLQDNAQFFFASAPFHMSIRRLQTSLVAPYIYIIIGRAKIQSREAKRSNQFIFILCAAEILNAEVKAGAVAAVIKLATVVKFPLFFELMTANSPNITQTRAWSLLCRYTQPAA
jgi:hypothetical protein